MDFTDLKYNFESSSINLDGDTFFIYAHTNEYLYAHILKTKHVFNNLIDKSVLKSFYNTFKENQIINLSYDEFEDIIFDCINFHDVGKISFKFQVERLNSKDSYVGTIQKNILNKFDWSDNLMDNLTADHSLTSALVFLSKYEDIFDENKLFLLSLAHVINGHHTYLKDLLKQSQLSYSIDEKTENTFRLLSLFLGIKYSEEDILEKYDLNVMQDNTFEFLNNDVDDLYSPISFFYMYIYSLLIVSDVFASDKSNFSLEEVKKLNFNNRIYSNLHQKMKNSFYNIPYNNDLNYSDYMENLNDVKDINFLRKQMLLESSKNLINQISNKNVFFLNMPTGGGKTNTSMKLALDILENTTTDRIIYAMPFINIIEQNFDVICKSFGLSEDEGEIRKIYSGSETLFSNKTDDYKNNILLNDDFFNYPVICTTFVSLFDSIIKSNKKLKYKLSSLANSVIILDEIQSLPLKNWNSLYYIINELAQNYNIYFIIMSATLPDFDKLKLDSNTNFSFSNISLINNPSKYYNHYLFNRTEIKDYIKSFELNENQNKEFIEYLWSIIQDNFNQGYTKGLMVFNTIKSSRLIFDKLSEFIEEKEFEDDTLDLEINLLNSSLMPATKRSIISKINNLDDEKKYILISTQSVEAGVDVSFDFVVRDFAMIDSIEQIRGRCNRSRELNKRFDDEYKMGNIYLTKLVHKKNNHFFDYIYSEEEMKTRIKCTDNLLNNSLNYSFSNINEYYANVSNLINCIHDEEEKSHFIDRDNIKYLNKMKFSKLMDKNTGINIIDTGQDQFSIFICTDVSIFSEDLETNIFDLDDESMELFYQKNKEKSIFSLNEIKFIKNLEYDEELYGFNRIHGESILNYYTSLLKTIDKKNDYFQFKLLQKEFSSIFYKFIINISINSYEDLYSEINSLKLIDYFRILPKDKIGDTEFKFYSLEKGFNYKPTIVNIL
ncbi:CRISPR-associated helicase/endonuclease Cas3 [Methanobrevibacter olleyae]|uniref:CRISPR-associated helicase Cas3 n=1 Tax=Methanobrevibacter olleyae TaxID=294671 RepID=A0A126QXU2_METOL|nr:CRISPR-associated helicase/endonuclease Cas3 [Methanobrevibacter olleyae]AMK14950.1 CRISPR-associated helicase Cas3 [Methanobrevibacter olleyae]